MFNMHTQKSSFSYLLLITLILGSTNISAQSWRSLNGPSESDIRDIVITTDSIYVAAHDPAGLFKKSIGSQQWIYSAIVDDEGAGAGALLSINIGRNGYYYAGANGVVILGNNQGYGHFFFSQDYGNSWEEYRRGLEYTGSISDIKVLPSKDVLVSGASGIFKKNTQANGFTKVASTFVSFGFYQKQDTIIAGNHDGLQYSTDEGESWVQAGPDTLQVHAINFVNGTFLLGTNQGLYTANSLNGTWSHFNDLNAFSIQSLFVYNQQVLVGTESGAYLFDPALMQSQPVFPALDEAQIHAINAHNDTIYMGTNRGLYTCDLASNECSRDGVPSTRIRTMNVQGKDTLWASTTQNIYRYFINTAQWDSLSIPVESARSIIPINQDSLFTISTRYFLRCFFEHGACDSTRFSGSGTTLFDLKENTDGDLFLASKEHVFKSTDKGKNWQTIYSSPNDNIFSLKPYADSLLFIGYNIKYALNTGTYDTLSKNISSITENGVLYSTENGVHKSTDFGSTWTTILRESDIIRPAADRVKIVLSDEENGKLYAISKVGRIYVNNDNGLSWGVNDEMYPIPIENALIGAEGRLFLGTSSAGVFINTQPLNPPITISNEKEPNSTIPKGFTLYQNYPNPFNPSTIVSYELKRPSEVSLTLFNLFGQKVKEYKVGYTSSGTHQYKIDLQHQASGLYFLRLKAGKNSQTIKMSFIK